ncbi:hypothetical protein RRG08_041791 [Elysia crispata]|uniref:Lipocalin/cytosolic fatty-acid binding domain-containing protein n=1 Tax=Elysia crispata TaxID=231223 RepID=A0AAE1EBJ2_9GAST|nr:hypothetical protein RRG08_041791 [Elysia crispata]
MTEPLNRDQNGLESDTCGPHSEDQHQLHGHQSCLDWSTRNNFYLRGIRTLSKFTMIEKLLDVKFKSEGEQGLEEYMSAQKVGFMLRKIAKNLTLYETLTKEGDTYTYSFESTFKNHKMVFKLGESFVDHGVDGRDMKTTFFVEGDALIATQENIKEGDVPSRIERRLRPDGKLEAKFISTPTDTTCIRVFAPVTKK